MSGDAEGSVLVCLSACLLILDGRVVWRVGEGRLLPERSGAPKPAVPAIIVDFMGWQSIYPLYGQGGDGGCDGGGSVDGGGDGYCGVFYRRFSVYIVTGFLFSFPETHDSSRLSMYYVFKAC